MQRLNEVPLPTGMDYVPPSAPGRPTDCQECEVALKDHMHQIYDPVIDFCAQCMEAEKDHRLWSPNNCQIIEQDCQECREESPFTFDLTFLDNQVQPRYSDSRERRPLKRKAVWSDDRPPIPRFKTGGQNLYCHWNSHNEDVQFADELEFDNHVRHHLQLDSTDLSCQWDSCAVSLDVVEDILQHIKTDHLDTYALPHTSCKSSIIREQNDLKCQWDNCLFTGGDLGSLVHHVAATHINPQSIGLASPEETPESISQNAFQCDFDSCTFESFDFDQLNSHMKTEHKDIPPHTCKWVLENGQTCGCVFPDTQILSDHLVEEHVGFRKSEYICNWKNCDRCQKPFAQRQKIVRHLQVHSNHRPFKCDVCGSRFGEESVLKQHLRVHSGEKPFECKVCHKHFAASAALSVHLRTHTGEKPLKCKFPGCEKRFSESSNLNKHLKTHYNGKPFACPVCENLRFAKKVALEEHVRNEHNM
jgi:hypothetical protein